MNRRFSSFGDGDTLILSKLDRLARSTTHLLAIVEKLETREVGRLKGVEYSLDQPHHARRLVFTAEGNDLVGPICKHRQVHLMVQCKKGATNGEN